MINSSNASISTDGNCITITTNTSGEKLVFYPLEFTDNDDFSIECEAVTGGTIQPFTMIIKDAETPHTYLNYASSISKWNGYNFGASFEKAVSLVTGDKVKFTRISGTTNVYINNELISSKTGNYSGTFRLGHYTNNGRVQKFKNTKIRRL